MQLKRKKVIFSIVANAYGRVRRSVLLIVYKWKKKYTFAFSYCGVACN